MGRAVARARRVTARDHPGPTVTRCAPAGLQQSLALMQAQHAREAIVVGSRGMHDARRLVLGSVPNKLPHQARCLGALGSRAGAPRRGRDERSDVAKYDATSVHARCK